MSTDYDTARSSVANHVTRIIDTFLSGLNTTGGFNDYHREILDESRDSMSRDLDHAITTVLQTEITNMEGQGQPVGDMSQLKFLASHVVPVDVDDVLMIGSINGEGWPETEEFNVPLEPSTAEEVEAKNRAREEREARRDQEEYEAYNRAREEREAEEEEEDDVVEDREVVELGDDEE
ncbi:hypothetical protein I350_06611 [Cryptococcus amylolentus CBS 6273]|uniref:Uncharacterized protein n=1 Tax=Cryptococcus amylolentus CBS 6273 TaxID=1296118 RepID=A0A1E3JPE3_9TREE|nr:hypothetical protein I350_06611 [Cryptococcus amylolentus CBS 6273]